MENSIKKRFFWEEILEIIPFGVSLRTFSQQPKVKTNIERVLGFAEASPAQRENVKREPDSTKKFF